MARMPDLFHEAEEAVFGRHRHHQAPAATAAARTNQGDTMSSLFTEAKTILHDVAAKLEAIDENAVGAVEAIKANPTGVSIVNEVASVAHIPDPQGLLAGALAMLQAVGASLRAAAAATAAQQAAEAPAAQ